MLDSLLQRRSRLANFLRADLARLRIPMSTIVEAADKASQGLQKELGESGASVALAIALGRLCAEAGLGLEHVMAMVEITNREALAELERVVSSAA